VRSYKREETGAKEEAKLKRVWVLFLWKGPDRGGVVCGALLRWGTEGFLPGGPPDRVKAGSEETYSPDEDYDPPPFARLVRKGRRSTLREASCSIKGGGLIYVIGGAPSVEVLTSWLVGSTKLFWGGGGEKIILDPRAGELL